MPALFSCCHNRSSCEKQGVEGLLYWGSCPKRENFYQIVGLYYLRQLACQIIVKILIFDGSERPFVRWDYWKVVYYTTLWTTPFNVQDVNVILTHFCERF